jgi:hypothetical protein
MDRNTIERILDGLDILSEALKMDDTQRLKEFGTDSLPLIINMIQRLVEEAQS